MRFIKIFLILILSLNSLSLIAQLVDEINEKTTSPPPALGYRYAMNLDIFAPHIVSSAANRQLFKSIIGVNFDFDIKLFKKFRIGIYARYVGYVTQKAYFLLVDDSVSGDNNFRNLRGNHVFAGIKLAYEVNIGERFAFIPAVLGGGGWANYNNIICFQAKQEPINQFGYSFSAEVPFYYYVRRDRKLGIGINIGYTYFSHRLELDNICLDGIQNEENEPSDDGKFMYLNFGFSIIYKLHPVK